VLVDYWNRFQDHLTRRLNETSDEEFTRAWKSQTDRTQFYLDRLLKDVAISLSLELRTELFRVDYAFCERTKDNILVPLIFLESENAVGTAEHEVHKLCALAGPLKILMICAEWGDEPGRWRHGGCKEKYLSAWKKIIKAHGAIWPQPCVYGVIAAEWSDKLRYYSVCLNSFGEERDEHRVFFEREIA
jgi:hypothetical protein